VNWLDAATGGPGPLVVVLPYAGAIRPPSALVRAAVGPGVTVTGMTYPGHGAVGGQLIDDAEELLDGIVSQLMPLAGPRLVLVGFSLGGNLAFELAQRLTAARRPPAGLVICVARAPHTGVGHRPVSGLAGGEFVSQAVRLGMLAPAAAGLDGMSGMIEALRADLRIVERMPFRAAAPPLTGPAAVIGATGDWLVPDPSLRRWADVHAVAPLQFRIPGGHLTWVTEPGPMTTALSRALLHVLPGAGGAP
jgi:surfactin synthase thioesterase subunit